MEPIAGGSHFSDCARGKQNDRMRLPSTVSKRPARTAARQLDVGAALGFPSEAHGGVRICTLSPLAISVASGTGIAVGAGAPVLVGSGNGEDDGAEDSAGSAARPCRRGDAAGVGATVTSGVGEGDSDGVAVGHGATSAK